MAQLAESSIYTPPRAVDGHPDLQGIWQVLHTSAWDLDDNGASLGVLAGQSVTEVIVNGYLARSGEPVVNGRSVTTPDGRNFFLGADSGGPANR